MQVMATKVAKRLELYGKYNIACMYRYCEYSKCIIMVHVTIDTFFKGDEVRSKVTEKKEKQMDKEKQMEKNKDMEKKQMEKNEKEKVKDTSVIRQQSKLLTVLVIFMFYVMY